LIVPSPIANGVPHGTGISIVCNPKISIFNLQLDGTSGTPVWLKLLEELAVGELLDAELDDLDVEDLLVLDDLMVEDLEVDDLLVLDDLTVDDLEVEDLLVEDLLLLEDFIVELLEVELFEVELGAIAEEFAAGVAEDTLTVALELDGATTIELEANKDDTTLEETTGVADELDSIVELLETTELGAMEAELITLDTETADDELTSSSSEEVVEARLDTDELTKTEEDETVWELVGVEELATNNELMANGEDKLELTRLELRADETSTEETTLELELEESVGVALNTIFRGLSHGIVKSKLIENILYCTRQVRPSPVGKVWALAFGVKIADKEAKLSVKTKAEIVR
jgi:hypothetical protein